MDTGKPENTIASQARVCEKLFDKLRENWKSNVEGCLLEEQRARFNLWASNLGVFQTSKVSLDFRLREAPILADAILQLLETVSDYLLTLCHNDEGSPLSEADDLAETARQNLANEASHPRSRQSSSSDDSDSQLQLTHTDSRQVHEVIRLEIGPIITRLQRLSVAIRQSTRVGRNLRALDYKGNNVDTKRLLAELERFTESLVRSKFPEMKEELFHRIVATICMRRRRLYYQRDHHTKLYLGKGKPLENQQTTEDPARPMEAPQNPSDRDALMAGPVQPSPGNAAAPEQARTIPETKVSTIDERKARSLAAKSIKKSQRAKSALQNSKLEFPKPPKPHVDSTEVECPYCQIILSEEEWSDVKYRQHVIKDLETYVCVLPNCFEPPQMFEAPGSWLNHMRLPHAEQWCCSAPLHESDGPIVFEKEGDFRDHMRYSHPGTFTESQMPSLAHAALRSASPYFDECPFGDDFKYTTSVTEGNGLFGAVSLQDHVVGHLKELALLSLPPIENAESDSLSSASGKPEVESWTLSQDFEDEEEAAAIAFPVNNDYSDDWSEWAHLGYHWAVSTPRSEAVGMTHQERSKLAASFGIRTKLGLDDPRVTKCFDRGDNFYRQDHPFRYLNSSTSATSPPGSHEIISTILAELYNAQIPYPLDSVYHHFVPRDELSRIMAPERVRLVITSLECCNKLSPDEKEELTREVCIGGSMWCREPCLKLLAVLIAVEIEEKLFDLIKDGVTDFCLPFETVPGTNNNLRCQMPDHQHPAINECWHGYQGQPHRHQFCRWTYALSAPYFKRPQGGHAHYILGVNDILPIIQEKARGPSEAPSRETKPSEFPDSGEGEFSQVQRVKFQQSHFDFGSYGIHRGEHEEHFFALKKSIAPDVDSFNKELEPLLSFQDQDEKHLVKLLVTFEIKQTGGGSSTFYLVFPWAEGDLWHFWRMHQALDQRIPRCLWMAEQCYQLALALMYVHNERKKHLHSFNDVMDHEHDLYGRHGDVKADNVLYFEDPDILVMTDFGLGRLHTKISRSNQDLKTLEKTATYRAPEFDTRQGKISRACDIFSLGCMFLEFVTWYLLGWESVSDEFPNYRLEKDIYDFISDTFFRIEGSLGDPTTPIIKPKVVEWIRMLQQSPNCNQYLLDFLSLIENRMLDPNSTTRIKSNALVRELDLYVKTCRTDSDYYKEARSYAGPD